MKIDKKSNYDIFCEILEDFFKNNGLEISFKSNLKDCSKNDAGNVYLYNGEKNLGVISMDIVAQQGYKQIMNAEGKNVLNTADAFIVNSDNEWFFIEFKDCKISSKKDNIEKKGMANWLMLQGIFNSIGENGCNEIIDLSNLSKFAREHIVYIVVCSSKKDPFIYNKVRDCEKIGKKYTPDCLMKFKYYFFKDAYAYTENYFEKLFVKKFEY